MELSIKPHHRNEYPIKGIFVRGENLRKWAQAVSDLNKYGYQHIQLFPISGNIPNTIWGAIIITSSEIDTSLFSHFEFAQKKGESLFLPESVKLVPQVSDQKLIPLLKGKNHCFHPEFGLFLLESIFDWSRHITLPSQQIVNVLKPAPGVFIPKSIKSLSVSPPDQEDLIKKLEKEAKPEKKYFADKPLNLLEKARLKFYQSVYKDYKSTYSGVRPVTIPLLDKLMNSFNSSVKEDFENLEERNQSELDKLKRMIKDDPDEALKYAIPLSETGLRGENQGAFVMGKLRNEVSLFGKNRSYSSSGVGTVFSDQQYTTLQEQYQKMAKTLIDKGDFRKAAFVYIKLLKDIRSGAKTLESGNLYPEAATLYMKELKDKKNAARCYEKGSCYQEATELYLELEAYEELANVYQITNNTDKANWAYFKLIEKHLAHNKYLKAYQVCIQNIGDKNKGQEILLEGWENRVEATQCLEKYVSNLGKTEETIREIYRLSEEFDNKDMISDIVQVLSTEFRNDGEENYKVGLKNLAYSLISRHSKENTRLLDRLRVFTPSDKLLQRDISRFKHGRNKRI